MFSFHCPFCRGFEDYTHLPIGNLGLSLKPPKLAQTLAFSLLSMRYTSAAEPPTVLTHGIDAVSTTSKMPQAAAVQAAGVNFESRPITRIVYDPAIPDQVTVEFEGGGSKVFGFLICKPDTETVGPWTEHLGLEMVESTPKSDIKLVSPFGETSVRGVFAAGDCITQQKQVANAIASGVTAGAGVAVTVGVERVMDKMK